MSLFSKFFSQKPTKDERHEAPEFTLSSKANPSASLSSKSDSAYRTGSFIANRYEVVQGPREKPSLAGGMGLVYLCVDHAEDGRPVALKTFQSKFLPDRAARDRFLREGTTWIELGKHPHIVRCHQVFKAEVGPEVFFVLEFVAAAEGKRDASLRSWLTPAKPLPVEQALLFALHIARGMKHATTKILGLVHRDLKPENVLVGCDGIARVTDFGLAHAVQKASGKVSGKANLRMMQLTKDIVGTPLYMAPEQWAGAKLDVRTDIYAFGCILYEMLVGYYAVTGNNLRQLEQAHRAGNASRAKLPKGLSKDVIEILRRCVARTLGTRYASWADVETALANEYCSETGKDAPGEVKGKGMTRVERVAAGWSYNTMGASYADIGKFSVARDYFDKVLAIGQQEGERSLQAAALGNLGEANRRLGDARGAIGYCEQHLAIVRDIGDRRAEGNALVGLGNAYLQLGDARGAIGYYEQRLAIACEIGDRQGEATALGNLGNAYLRLGDARDAIGYYEQHLAIAREIGDRHGEAAALGNLGTAYAQLGDARGAIEYHEQRLTIAREIGDHHGEGQALGNLGNVYADLGDVGGSIGYYEQCLAIAREIGDRHDEAAALGNLGNAYADLGDARGAIGYCEQHLAIAREIGDRHGEGQALGNLGTAYADLGDARQAIKLLELAFTIMQALGDVMNGALFSFNLARLLTQKGRFRAAEAHAAQAEQLFTQAGHSEYAARAQELLAQIRSQKG